MEVPRRYAGVALVAVACVVIAPGCTLDWKGAVQPGEQVGQAAGKSVIDAAAPSWHPKRTGQRALLDVVADCKTCCGQDVGCAVVCAVGGCHGKCGKCPDGGCGGCCLSDYPSVQQAAACTTDCLLGGCGSPGGSAVNAGYGCGNTCGKAVTQSDGGCTGCCDSDYGGSTSASKATCKQLCWAGGCGGLNPGIGAGACGMMCGVTYGWFSSIKRQFDRTGDNLGRPVTAYTSKACMAACATVPDCALFVHKLPNECWLRKMEGADGVTGPATDVVVSGFKTVKLGHVVSLGTAPTGMPAEAYSNVVKVCSGFDHVLGLVWSGIASGHVISWGLSFFKALPATQLTDVVDICCGAYHSMVLFRNGTVSAFGLNTAIVNGNSQPAGQSTVPGGLPSTIVQIACGYYHSLALLSNGTTIAWGYNSYQQASPPTAAQQDVKHIGAGAFSSYAILQNNTMVQWGKTSPVPAAVAQQGVLAVAAGRDAIAAVLRDQSLVTWGAGEPAVTAADMAALLSIPAAARGKKVVAVAAGQYHFSAATDQGQLVTWGLTNPEAFAPGPALGQVLGMSCGSNFTLALVQGDAIPPPSPPPPPSPSPSPPPVADIRTPVPSPATQVPTPPEPLEVTTRASDAPMSSGAASSDAHTVSTGIIVGIAVAGAVSIAAAAGIAVWLYRRQKYGPASVEHDVSEANACGYKQPPESTDEEAATPMSGDQDSDPLCSKWPVVSAASVVVQGLMKGEVFLQATAKQFAWSCLAAMPGLQLETLEASINDTALDKMACHADGCKVVQLSRRQLKQQVLLLTDGLLGRGASALVFKCVWPSRFGDTTVLACKVLKDGYEPDVKMLESFNYEAVVLAAARHTNVVRIYGYCLDPPSVCIIMELLPSSLKDVLYRHAPLLVPKPASAQTTSSGSNRSSMPSPRSAPSQRVPKDCHPSQAGVPVLTSQEVARISTDIAAGLAYLHASKVPGAESARYPSAVPRGSDAVVLLDGSTPPTPMSRDGDAKGNRIVHRDLKPANILINSLGVAKISDFGLAREHDRTTIGTVHLGAGTLPYMAPELLVAAHSGFVHNAATNRVDIYSLGMIIWECLAGQPPWKGHSEVSILSAVVAGKRPGLPRLGTDTSPDDSSLPVGLASAWSQLIDIIRACWQQRELRRPTAQELHRMLAEVLQQHPEPAV